MNASIVIIRDLRRLARRRGTFTTRAIIGTLAFFVLWGTAFGVDWGLIQGIRTVPKGKAVLFVLSQFLLFACVFMGISVTADSLSQERREGTLGLLLLTPLSWLDLLIGRLISSSMTTVYGLVSLIPVVSLTMLFGGVTFGEFIRLVILLANTLFISLLTGLFVSCASSDSRKGLTTSLFLMGLIVFGPFVCVGILLVLELGLPVRVLQLLMAGSPLSSLVHSGCTPYSTYDRELFLASIVAGHLLAWGLFFGSGFVLKRSFQRERSPSEPRSKDWGSRFRKPSRSLSWLIPRRYRSQSRRKLLEGAPYGWLMARDGSKRARVDFYLIVMVIMGFASYLAIPDAIEFFVFLFCLAVAFVKLWWLIEVVTRLWSERGSGSLELLLTSPLGLNGIVQGVNRGLWFQFSRGILGFLVVSLVFFAIPSAPESEDFVAGFRLAYWPVTIGFFLDLWALKWAGMWSAVTARGSTRAYLVPLVVVCGVPWLLTGLIGGMAALIGEILDVRPDGLRFEELVMIWSACSFPFVLAYGFRARYQFLHRTRSLAMHGFSYRAALAGWLASPDPKSTRQGAWFARLLWPKTLVKQSLAGIVLLILLIGLIGQSRRVYYERQLAQSLAKLQVEQEELPEYPVERARIVFGAVPEFLRRAASNATTVANLGIGSPDVPLLDPALSFAPIWSRKASREERLSLLERIRSRNAESIALLVHGGDSILDSDPSTHVPLESWQEVQKLLGVFELLGCEIYYHVLKGDMRSASQSLLTAARIKQFLSDSDVGQLRFYGRSVIRLDSWLRLVLSLNGLSLRDLNELDAILGRIDLSIVPGESIRGGLKFLQANLSFDTTLWDRVADPKFALLRLLLGMKQLSGENAREWADYVAWVAPVLAAVDSLETGGLSSFQELTDSYRWYQSARQGQASAFRSAAESVAEMRVSEMDFVIDTRVRVRMMRCALSLTRYRLSSGQFPESPDMSDSDIWIDSYSGETFRYSKTDDRFILQSATKWTIQAGQGEPLVLQLPVDRAALGDLN